MWTEKCDPVNFQKTLTKLYGRMITLESQKLEPPKFSRSIGQLVKFLGIEIGEEQLSQHEASLIRLLSKKSSNGGFGSSLDENQTHVQGYTLEPSPAGRKPSRYDSSDRKPHHMKFDPDNVDTS